MTKQRMEDILVALEQDGWRFVGTDDPGGDRFALREETVRWSVVRGESAEPVELEFRAYGPLGQMTDRAADIFFVNVVGGDEILHFEKRTRAEWRTNLRELVLALNRLAERGRRSKSPQSPERG